MFGGFGNQSTTQQMGGLGTILGGGQQTQGLFGQPQQQQQQTTQGLFGQPQQQQPQGGLFNQQQSSFGQGLGLGGQQQGFGQQQPQQQQQQTTFGAAGGFGSAPQQQQGLFGSGGQTGFGVGFGQQQPQQQQPQQQSGLGLGGQTFGGFGAQPQQQGSIFGGLGLGQQQPQQNQLGGFGQGQTMFGQQQPQQQTNQLGMGFGGILGSGNTGLGLGGQQQPQQQGLFGSQPQQPQPFGGQTGTGFGQQGTQGLFGQPQQQQQTLFAQPQQQQSAFGQTQPLFGQQQPQQQQQSSFSAPTFGQTGQTTTPGFGQGLFGQQQQQPQTGFLGQQQQQQQPGFGGFQLGGGGTQNQSVICPQGGQDDSENDIKLDPKFRIEDTISAIVWAPQLLNFLACSSWDGKIKIYEIVQTQYNRREIQERKIIQVDGAIGNVQNPIICMDCKMDFSILFCGCGFDNQVKAIDVNSGQVISVGMHNQPVIAVFWLEQMNLILSISFDQTLKLHDPRQPGQTRHQIQFNYKPLVADFSNPILVIGFASEKIAIININEIQNVRINYIDSPLGQYSQLTSLTIFPNKDGFGIGSIDGRGHLTNIASRQVPGNQSTEYQLKSIMTFKAHKIEDHQKGKTINYFYPVNSVLFNPRNSQFLLTAGGEGQMIFWDIQVRNKIKTFQFNNNPIVCGKISPDGQMLAYALGNDFSKGTEHFDQFPHKLCVHVIPDNELRCANR